jgi:hypothetical protein
VPPDEQPSFSSAVQPYRPSLFRRIKQFVTHRARSGKINTTNVSHLTGLVASPMASAVTLRDDTWKQRSSTIMEIFPGKEIKDWTCDDIEDFINLHQFGKFMKILSGADGRYLYRLYLMSEDNNNKLLEYMREENPEIKLSDYLRFAQTIEDYVQQTNTDD